jgi:predicted DNA-binding transcriptional regulator AlpA
MEFDAFSIPEFCRRHGISRSAFYNALAAGTGPRIMKVGSRTLISREAAAEWRRRCESAGANGPSNVKAAA